MRRLVIIDQDGNSIKNDIFEKIFDIRESEIERKLEVRESFIKENNLKDISKYNTKIKNNKDIVENECSKLIISVLKKETDFLKKLIEEEKTNEKNNQTI